MPQHEADEVITQLLRPTRYLRTLKGRPPFRLAGLETYERLQNVAQCSLDLLAERYDPRLAQLYQGLQAAWAPCTQTYQAFQQRAAWLRDIAYILAPTAPQALGGAQVAGQLRDSLDTVLRWPEVTPTCSAFGRHLDTVSRSYWPGLFHCYDVPGLPRTNNALESCFRDTGRRLLRTTGQQGLTQRMLQRQGAWALLPRPPTESQVLDAMCQTSPEELAQDRQRFAAHRQRFRLQRHPCDRLKRNAINCVRDGRHYSLQAQGDFRDIAVAGWKQLDMQHAAGKLGTEVPYDTAQSLCEELTGMHFGSERLHTVTNQVGAGWTVWDGAPSRQEIERRIAAVSAGRFRRPVLVLGIDGAYVPPRPDSARGPCEGRRGTRAPRTRWRGQWRDAKGLRFSLLEGERIVPVLSWHQGQNEEQRGEALKQVKEAGVIPEEQVRLCVVCDGAEWIWQHVQALFPQACQVFDYSHCAQSLHRVANAHYGASVQAVEWGEATMTRLSLGKVGVVLGGLRHMQAQAEEAEKALANCWDSLNEHRGRTAYQKLRRGGYPLGSGGIESSHKFVCHVRLKRSGAWWYEVNSNHMLALRCAKYNSTLDQVFVRYQQQ